MSIAVHLSAMHEDCAGTETQRGLVDDAKDPGQPLVGRDSLFDLQGTKLAIPSRILTAQIQIFNHLQHYYLLLMAWII